MTEKTLQKKIVEIGEQGLSPFRRKVEQSELDGTLRELDFGDELHEDLMVVNMGPQHPSTHGVLRLVLTLDGEVILDAEPVVGYLHRGKEKMAEHLGYFQYIPHTDRLDYLAPQINNVAFCQTVEKAAGLEVPPRGQAIRVILMEMMRLTGHLIYAGTTALDIGAASMFFYTFREREDLLDLVDQVTGHRMNNAYIRIGGVGNEIPEPTLRAIKAFAERMDERVDEYEHLLTSNKIWWDRNRDVGVMDKELALSLGMTGPNLRGSGVEFDLRRAQPYSGYENYDFEVPVGTVGDCYDRYLVRMEEMRQSARIILQAIDKLPAGEIYAEDRRFVLPPKEKVFTHRWKS